MPRLMLQGIPCLKQYLEKGKGRLIYRLRCHQRSVGEILISLERLVPFPTLLVQECDLDVLATSLPVPPTPIILIGLLGTPALPQEIQCIRPTGSIAGTCSPNAMPGFVLFCLLSALFTSGKTANCAITWKLGRLMGKWRKDWGEGNV